MIMWDPATYPQVKTIADLGKTGATVKFFSGAAFMSYFTSAGILNKAQTDGSYDGHRYRSSPPTARLRNRDSVPQSRTFIRTNSNNGASQSRTTI